MSIYRTIDGECGSTTKPNLNCILCALSLNLQALDYEEKKELHLEVAVSNKASYNFGSGIKFGNTDSKSYPIKINVINQKEGPRFQPSVKVVTSSEDLTSISLNKVIANYAAIDSDTLKTATNVRYGHIQNVHLYICLSTRISSCIDVSLCPSECMYDVVYMNSLFFLSSHTCISILPGILKSAMMTTG